MFTAWGIADRLSLIGSFLLLGLLLPLLPIMKRRFNL